jgi:hypothetical protein
MSARAYFSMKLPSVGVSRLVTGKLRLSLNAEGTGGILFEALSGSRGWQYKGSWVQKGRGCLPPRTDYEISTQRLWLPHVKGVEGSFYAISPFLVNAGNGVMRGDFGVHFDANVPGSAGCIVLPRQDHWDIWRKQIEDLRKDGVQSIPLEVSYE